MRLFLALVFIGTSVMAAETTVNERDNSLEVQDSLKEEKTIPYFKDGKVEGYIAQPPSTKSDSFSDLGLRRGETVTGVNEIEDEKK